MSVKRNVRRTLANPLAVIVPMVVILLFAWNQYVRSGRDLSLSGQNILPNGAFDEFDDHGTPRDWTLAKSGDLAYQTSSDKGYVAGKLLNLQVSHYKSGSLELRSQKISVRGNTTYLYKGYYQSTTSFDLLVRYFYTNGSSSLKYVRSYPGNNDPWSTASVGFQTGHTIDAVQFIYRVAANGTLKLDDTYLEAKSAGVYVPPLLRDTNMLIPNAGMSAANGSAPSGWEPYHRGRNRAQLTYHHDSGQPSYVSANITNYKSGEAKWQYAPQAVQPGQAFTFGVGYRSNARPKVIVEYVMQNGKHRFDTIATLSPSSDWTRYQTTFEAPAGATTMFASVVLQSNGMLDTDSYALRNSTRSGGQRQFDAPLVSLTFDDGWKSINDDVIPAMSNYGYHGTFYLNPSSLDTTNFVNTQQVMQLERDGQEVASHGFSHVDMTSVNANQLDYQLREGQSGLRAIHAGEVRDFATPYGKADAEVQFYARKYYQSMRSTDSGLNTRQNFDPYNLKVLYVSDKTTDAEVRAALKDARAYHGWLILVYHRVQTTPSRTTAAGENTVISPKAFDRQLQLIQHSGIVVQTVENALHTLQSQ